MTALLWNRFIPIYMWLSDSEKDLCMLINLRFKNFNQIAPRCVVRQTAGFGMSSIHYCNKVLHTTERDLFVVC